MVLQVKTEILTVNYVSSYIWYIPTDAFLDLSF